MDEMKYVVVKVGEQFFGIDIENVVEIKEKCEVTMLPNSKSNILGIMNLRNDYIPVYSFRKKMGIAEDSDLDNKVVVVNIGDLNIGIKIDSVREIANVEEDNLFELPLVAQSDSTKYVYKIANINKDLVILVNLGEIITVDDINHIDQILSTVK